jgi:hypothetical protein
MGYVIAHSPCFGCGQPFGFNPHAVPSIPFNGERYPICADCVEVVNPARIANGLEPIVPLPGAYDPIEESEL